MRVRSQGLALTGFVMTERLRMGVLTALAVFLVSIPAVAERVSTAVDEFDPRSNGGIGYWDQGTEPAAERPPDGFTKELVLDRLGIAGGVCGWAVKAWGPRPLYVAVADQGESLFVGVFEKGETIELQTRGKLSLGESSPRFHHFDFAPYRIRPEETAIGFRTAHAIAYSGGGGECESLALVRLQDDRLSLVLYTQTDYSAMIRGEQFESGAYAHHDVAATATLSVSGQKTRGFFDYVKSIEGSGDDEHPDRKVRFEWNGDRYQAEGEVEPLEVNCLVVGVDMDKGDLVERFPTWVRY